MKSRLIFKMPNAPKNSQGKNLAQELGYDKDTRLLVVNSDDSGAHPCLSEGAQDVMAHGMVKSTSVNVNDRNDAELARVAKAANAHPEWGFGLHLALTNEYQDGYPWAPVLSKEEAPTLYNSKGYCWELTEEVAVHVDPREAAREFEAQLKKAQKFGIPLTHIDSHMGTAYVNSSYPGAEKNGFRKAAIALAEKYSLPMTINVFDKDAEVDMKYMDKAGIIRPDTFFGVYACDELNDHLSYTGNPLRKLIVKKVVKSAMGLNLPYYKYTNIEDDTVERMRILKDTVKGLLEPGLNHIFMHAAVEPSQDGTALPTCVHRPPNEDRNVRLADVQIWTSKEARKLFEEEGITLINYTELKKLQDKRKNAGT